MQSLRYHAKGSELAWFNRLPPYSISSFIELSITFASHFIGARTYRKPSYHLLTIKKKLAGKPEVICSEVQRGVSEGRYSRREVRHHSLHRRARGAVKGSDVLHLKKPLGEHGRGASQNREVYQWQKSPLIQAKELFYSKGKE